MNAPRFIRVVGRSYGRPGVEVVLDEDGLRGDPFVVELVQNRVERGRPVAWAGVTSGPSTLDLDDPLLTTATLAEAFDQGLPVETRYEGIDTGLNEDVLEGAVY